MTTSSLSNQQFRLAARPVGLPKPSDWHFTTEPVAPIGDGEMVVQTLYLKDGMECEAVFYDGKAISVELPITIARQVVYAEPAVKGNTSGNVLKEARIENAIEAHRHTVQVPLFVSQDDVIEIDTRTNEYKKIVRS